MKIYAQAIWFDGIDCDNSIALTLYQKIQAGAYDCANLNERVDSTGGPAIFFDVAVP